MSLSIGTSLAASALPLEHKGSSRLLYNEQAEVNDEVLIAFEQGQLRSPFVVAPLWNSAGEPARVNAAPEIGHPDLQTRWPSLLGSLSDRTIPTAATQARVTTTRGDLDSTVNGLEEKVNSVGDDAQLANICRTRCRNSSRPCRCWPTSARCCTTRRWPSSARSAADSYERLLSDARRRQRRNAHARIIGQDLRTHGPT